MSFIVLTGQQDEVTAVETAMSIFGIHLLYFGASEVTSQFKGVDIFSKTEIEKRKSAVRDQIKKLVLGSQAKSYFLIPCNQTVIDIFWQ